MNVLETAAVIAGLWVGADAAFVGWLLLLHRRECRRGTTQRGRLHV